MNDYLTLGLSMNEIQSRDRIGESRRGVLAFPALGLAAEKLGMISAVTTSGPTEAGARGLAARAIEALTYWMPSLKTETVLAGSDLDRSARLLANMSHDLLTPITRMKLRAETISTHAIREKLFSDLDEMEGLVRHVLDYAGSTRRSEGCCTELDIAAFLNRLVCDYQDMKKHVVAVEPMAVVVVTSPRLLRRILTNLVDNALKFAGSAEIVTEMRTNSCVTVAVLDRGPGIPGRQLTAVIRPFFRLSPNIAQKPGLGLGLAIANNLARSLGGALALRNRDGGGLRAEIQLPVLWPPLHDRRHPSPGDEA